MANTTENLTRFPYGKDGRSVNLPVDGGSHIYEGGLVSQLTATGMIVPTTTAGAGPAVGVAEHEADNSSGADDAKRVMVETDRVFQFTNATSGEACSEALPLFSVVYAKDDHTISSNSAGGTYPVAGLFMGMSDHPTPKVRVYVGMNRYFQTNSQGDIPISLYDFREVSSGGDVSNIAGNGGLLASDTTPILRGDAAESQELAWAAANQDIIAAQFTLPRDFDGAKDVLVELWVYTDNTGGGGIEAATFTVETSWDGGAVVSDTATDTTPAVTIHKISATIAAADIPDSPSLLTLMLTPGTHANDPTQLVAARITYQKKP